MLVTIYQTIRCYVPQNNIKYEEVAEHIFSHCPLLEQTVMDIYCCSIVILLSYTVVCLTTGPKPLPKWFLHIVRSKASSFKWEYPLLSLRSSSSFLLLLPRLLVTSISPFIFPSITCFRRQFLRKMWPIQLAFRLNQYHTIKWCT